MRLIKRLDLFILKSFLPLFAMTFFIVLFIVLMQFLWKYIDDLVGKGLGLDVLGELFFYAAVSMVPMALPLAILLASLMTYGNFGEKFELTAMKASGISLLRAMAPVMCLVGAIAIGAFFFQNYVLPQAQVKMWTLVFSVKQKSPELDIPEGVFYDQITGYNLYVKHKNRETGMLYDVMIYDVTRPGDNSTILLADSARLAFTPDMRYLYLHLHEGEQFENLREQNARDRNVPFRRETFIEKEVLIPFDANFNRLDEGGMRKQYVGKNIEELRHTIDSVGKRVDSIGNLYARELKLSAVRSLPVADDSQTADYSVHQPVMRSRSDAGRQMPPDNVGEVTRDNRTAQEADKGAHNADNADKAEKVNLDSMLMALSPVQRSQVMEQARMAVQRQGSDNEFKATVVSDEKRSIRRHSIELVKKFTLSVACLIFFFIGAPLGAIIRKGGLGTPLVISVLLFLVYYIIDNTGYKMARDGRWPVWLGMWLSTAILAPLGIYVTYKAMNDSSVFDKDRYVALWRKLIGRRPDRSVQYKEVIINDISVDEARERLASLRDSAIALAAQCGAPVTYGSIWRSTLDRKEIEQFSSSLDADVEYLTDCRNPLAVNKLVNFPVIVWRWVLSPASLPPVICKIFKVFLPVGLPLFLVSRSARRRLRDELKKVADTADTISDLLDQYQGHTSTAQ